MTPFQIILIVALLFLFALYFIYFKNGLIMRLIMIGVLALGIGLTLAPETTSKVANALGIGRGADLIFYFCILLGVFGFTLLYAKYRKLEQLLTDLIRKETVRTAIDHRQEK
jgi:hypothetical protein